VGEGERGRVGNANESGLKSLTIVAFYAI